MLIRSALAVAAAGALAVVPVTAANAQTWRHTDPTGDVQSGTFTSDTVTPAPDAVDPDVSTIRVTHGPRKVTVQLAIGDIAKTPDSEYMFVMQLRTNEKLRRDLVLDAAPGAWRGRLSFGSPRRDVRCRGLARSIDYTANTVTVTIPRNCLSRPHWVQVGAGAVKTVGGNTDPSTATLYADDAISDTVGNNLTWGPRIRKG